MDDLFKEILKEDIGYGDVTSNALISDDSISSGFIVSKDFGILAGVDVVLDIFGEYGINVLNFLDDGSNIKPGDKLIEFEGDSKTILLLERTVLNILMRMSGVASKTNSIVSKVKDVNPNVRVAGTRKTSPALQRYDKEAIFIGGGDPHRNCLDDMVLIKDNHINIVGGVLEALKLAKENTSFSKKIEIEVETCEDAVLVAREGVDIVMLDNMSVDEALETINSLKDEGLRDGILVEVSGGITEDNILDYAVLDVDIISLGALTHSVSSLNFSLDVN